MALTREVERASDSRVADQRSGVLGGLEDFLQSTVYSAIQRPLDGLEQMVNHIPGVDLPELHIIDAPTDNNWETKLGSLAGNVADMVVIGTGIGAAFEATGVTGDLAAMTSIEAGAIRGATMGFVFNTLQPQSTPGNYWENKLKDTAVGTVAFATIGAAAAPIADWLGGSSIARLASRVPASAIGGIARVGVRDALYAEAPSLDQIPDALRTGMLGGIVGAADWASEQWRDLLAKQKPLPNMHVIQA